MLDVAIGIDVGGTKIAGGLVDRTGHVTHAIAAHTPAREGSAAIMATVIDVARQVRALADADGLTVSAAGLGAAGQIEYPRGRVRYASPTLHGWAGTEIAQILGAATGLPVAVDNDVNVLALAEQRFGAGREFSDVLFAAVGTGVGGALVLGGKLWRGASSTAGEIATLLVDVTRARADRALLAGRLESYASGPAIAARYHELAQPNDQLDLRAVAELARGGDALAQAAIRDGAVIFGLALNGLLNALDPQALIVGGGVPMLGELWWTPFVDTIRSNPMPGPALIAIRPAELLTHAPIAGAGALAFDHLS